MWVSKLMKTTIALITLAGVVTSFGLFVSRLWLRQIAVVLLAAIAIFTVVFTMNDMRAHGSEAQRLGRSPDFIAGMVARDQRMIPRRAIIFFSVSGLALLALVREKRKP